MATWLRSSDYGRGITLCRNEFSLVEDNLREFQDLRRTDVLESTSVKMEATTVDPKDKDEMEREGSEGGEAAATPVCAPPLKVKYM